MPGTTTWRGEMLVQAVGVGKVPQHVLDERARNVLNLVNRCAAAKIPEYAEERTANTPETAAFLRKIAAESIVLMKNEGDILPLNKDKKASPNTYPYNYEFLTRSSRPSSLDLTPRSPLTTEVAPLPWLLTTR